MATLGHVDTGLYRIRLELEGMKHAIVTAISAHESQVREEVEAQVKRVIDTVDWMTIINDAVEHEIRSAVKDGVRRALKHAMEYDGQVQEILKDAVSRGLVEAMSRAVERSMGG